MNNEHPPQQGQIGNAHPFPPTPHEFIGRLTIKLNGQEAHKVIAYDASAGWLERFVVEGGQPVIRGCELLTERVEGHVEVSWRDVPVE